MHINCSSWLNMGPHVQEQSCRQLLDNCFSMCSANCCFTEADRTGYVQSGFSQWALLSTGDITIKFTFF